MAAVKDNRDRRDADGDPEDLESAKGVIANQDEDMDILFDIIDTLLAQKEFDEAGCTDPQTDEVMTPPTRTTTRATTTPTIRTATMTPSPPLRPPTTPRAKS